MDPVPVSCADLATYSRSATGAEGDPQDVIGHLPEFAGDQHGSRFIQHKLGECNTEQRQTVSPLYSSFGRVANEELISVSYQVFDEILPNAYQLMTDVFRQLCHSEDVWARRSETESGIG